MKKVSATIWKSVLVGIAYAVALMIGGMVVRHANLSLPETEIRFNFLSHETLDKIYVMVFPDGSITIPRGGEYLNFGPFLEVEDLDQVLIASQFDTAKHLHQSRGWGKGSVPVEQSLDVNRISVLDTLNVKVLICRSDQ